MDVSDEDSEYEDKEEGRATFPADSENRNKLLENSPETWNKQKPMGQKLNFSKGLQIEIDSDQDDNAEMV